MVLRPYPSQSGVFAATLHRFMYEESKVVCMTGLLPANIDNRLSIIRHDSTTGLLACQVVHRWVQQF
jgi:hypothetical protein